MDFTAWTKEDLLALRESLDAWCKQYAASKWENRFWMLIGLMGAFALSDGLYAIFLFEGVQGLYIAEIVLGLIACFTWYKSYKRHKENKMLIVRIDEELRSRKKRKDSPSSDDQS